MSLFAGLEVVPASILHPFDIHSGQRPNDPRDCSSKDRMHSPLPDSSALEAGILEDDQPSRLSRVQDNVRHLLRTSVLGSVASSPMTPTHCPRLLDAGHHSPFPSTVPYDADADADAEDMLPIIDCPTRISTGSTLCCERAAGVPLPPSPYEPAVLATNHQSTMYNERAFAALDHPDLSDRSLPFLDLQKAQRRQQRCWKRSRHGKQRDQSTERGMGSHMLLCFLASLLLGALVATYLALAMTSSTAITPTFHILFVLAILLATIVFAHTVIRLCVAAGGRTGRLQTRRAGAPSDGRARRHRHHHHHHHHHRHAHGQHRHRPPHVHIPSPDAEPFVPPAPIPVHIAGDEGPADPRVPSQPPTTTASATGGSPADWDKEMHTVANPPPAYGRWRGSVRANPDLLHWRVVPSPTSPHSPALPSPTYEEAVGASSSSSSSSSSPPSYVTRESPARRREMREARAAVAVSQLVEPEMVEVRSVGLAM